MVSVRLAFDDDLLSDLTLKFNNDTVRVHKVILYRASGWFKRIFELQAVDKEPATNIIELVDDDTEALRIVLDRCYKDLNEDETSLLEACGHDFHYLVQVYLIAHKYDIQSVKTDALKAITRLLDDTEASQLVGSQWFVALDAAFIEVSAGLQELHSFLIGKIPGLLGVMMSEAGGYVEFQRVLNGNSHLGAVVVEVLRETKAAKEAAKEAVTKRRKCGKCHFAVAIIAEAGGEKSWEPGQGCFACGWQWGVAKKA